MKYPKALTGVRLFVPAEILCVIVSLLTFIIVILVNNIDFTNMQQTNVLINRLAVGYLLVNIFSIIAFVLKLVGFQIARKDERQFRKSLFFSVIGMIFILFGLFTAGTFASFVWGVNEVANLLVVIYAILAIYNLAEKEDDQDVMKRGKIALVFIAIIFGVAVINATITIFIPTVDAVFKILGAALDLLGHAAYLSFLLAAKKMLKNATV